MLKKIFFAIFILTIITLNNGCAKDGCPATASMQANMGQGPSAKKHKTTSGLAPKTKKKKSKK